MPYRLSFSIAVALLARLCSEVAEAGIRPARRRVLAARRIARRVSFLLAVPDLLGMSENNWRRGKPMRRKNHL